MDLSLFQPYRAKAPHHEDHLTWAFLNLIKLVPMALSTFVDLVAAKQRENSSLAGDAMPALSQLAYRTLGVHSQVTEIPQTTGRLVSIVMADERWEQSTPVQASDRGARFDGVICFDPTWVLVIENKPSARNIWEDQLHPPLPAGSELELSPGVVSLVWSDVIQTLGSLLVRGLCHGAEARLIEEFLLFTERHFPFLNPYSTLGLCKSDEYLLRRRCGTLLEGLGLGEAHHDRGFENYVRLPAGAADRVYLYPDGSGNLSIDLYPADTVGQTRDFLARLDREAFLGLADQGWSLEPHLHFAFMATHLHWSTSKVSAEAYLDYWSSHPGGFGQVLKADLPGRLAILVSEQLMTAEDVAAVERLFLKTERSKANVIPGWKVVHRVPIAEAAALDDRGELVSYIGRKVAAAVTTWGQAFGSSDVGATELVAAGIGAAS